MSKAPKTTVNDASVAAFLAGAGDPRRQADSEELVALMQAATGEPPRMWGSSIVGFGAYRVQTADGRENQWPLVGFSPRKGELVLYVMPGFESEADRLGRLGKHRQGKSCLYLKRLADVDRTVLREIIEASVREMRARHPEDDTTT